MTLTFKPVPEPPTELETVAAVREAVPSTTTEAADTADCCARVVDRTAETASGHVRDRDAAAAWLTFLRALELATDGAEGYRQTDRELERETLRTAFRERVYGAQSVIDALAAADEPLPAATVADRVQSRSHRRVQRDRIERILEWAVLLELGERSADEAAVEGDGESKRSFYWSAR